MENHRINLIYDTVSDAIFLLAVESTDNFRFVSVNHTFLEVTGLKAEQVIGKLAKDVIPPASYQIVKQHYHKAIMMNGPETWEEVSVYPTGTKTAIVTATPIFDHAGACTHIVGAANDITERKNLEMWVTQKNVELEQAYAQTLVGWASALELRDKETKGHSERVVNLTIDLAKRLGVADEKLIHCRRGALLHDIGKMGIPDNVLLKAGTLDSNELEVIKKHPFMSFQLLKKIPFLREAIDIPHYHHERWDGSGYPEGLKGTEIPYFARIFSIVDVYDALTHDRPYRPAWPSEKTLGYIDEQKGKAFDPKIAQEFIDMIRDNQK